MVNSKLKSTGFIMLITFLLSICIYNIFQIFGTSTNTLDIKPGERVSELRNINSEKMSAFSCLEAVASDEQLIDESQVIARGKITTLLGAYDYTLDEGNSVTRTLYSFELNDVLKGGEIKSIYISIPGELLPYDLQLNKEYVLCLTHIEGDYKNAYSLVSFIQGYFLINNDSMTNKLGERKEIDNFQKTINDVKEKNEKGIKIDSIYTHPKLQ